MSDSQPGQHSLDVPETNFARNEGGCARLFMILVAVFSPLLGICISVVYRTIGYRTMANRLLWISVVMLLVWGIAVVVGVTLFGATDMILSEGLFME
ncbi:MAG: hypothetical protein F4Z18_14120 [Caldilineaceae bacterium SB0666_bin_21]|nr:hypothetical protein [Caldilineaceae bacterium SB0666_bin_21]